jgi:S-adenosylmethionine synthetase
MQRPGTRTAAVEIVERKGIGHPDTICDALAEEVSRALSRHYLERFGRVLHHNVDKALLCGGTSRPRFGGGEVTAPIEIILAGRATNSFAGENVPVVELATDTCRAWLRAHLRRLDPVRDVLLQCRFRPGSQDLVDVFGRGRDDALPFANDTSIGVGFAPLTPLEESVLEVERWINSPSTKSERPETGEDVKIMAVRSPAGTQVTVACAFVDVHLRDLDAYLERKASFTRAIDERLSNLLGAQAAVVVNAADDPAHGSVYLTVTGTSAEAGDDGEVGRGNRVNGLITPGRPMTMEAAAGKNPTSHVGKLYNVVAGLIARELVSELRGVTAAECSLVSRIGARIDEPQVVGVRLSAEDGHAHAYEAAACEIVREHLSGIRSVIDRLVTGAIPLF